LTATDTDTDTSTVPTSDEQTADETPITTETVTVTPTESDPDDQSEYQPVSSLDNPPAGLDDTRVTNFTKLYAENYDVVNSTSYEFSRARINATGGQARAVMFQTDPTERELNYTFADTAMALNREVYAEGNDTAVYSPDQDVAVYYDRAANTFYTTAFRSEYRTEYFLAIVDWEVIGVTESDKYGTVIRVEPTVYNETRLTEFYNGPTQKLERTRVANASGYALFREDGSLAESQLNLTLERSTGEKDNLVQAAGYQELGEHEDVQRPDWLIENTTRVDSTLTNNGRMLKVEHVGGPAIDTMEINATIASGATLNTTLNQEVSVGDTIYLTFPEGDEVEASTTEPTLGSTDAGSQYVRVSIAHEHGSLEIFRATNITDS